LNEEVSSMKDKVKNSTNKALTPPKPLGLRVLGRAMLKAGKENNHQPMVEGGNKLLKMATNLEG
jgi:hypothetical protein